ncbi:hypothetical protein HGRIS_010480 [Hohenbuehelia grisea]|uniref:Uncharacterized protein n=1 Tax=Hohenbuehelia grisea TaxID=104357 RepID=A0ABR3IZ87_9AGAR
MDGNDSLKRVIRRGEAPILDDAPVDRIPVGPTIELSDCRDGRSGYFLTREAVDQWGGPGARGENAGGDLTEADGDDSPCSGRWKNMLNEAAKRGAPSTRTACSCAVPPQVHPHRSDMVRDG